MIPYHTLNRYYPHQSARGPGCRQGHLRQPFEGRPGRPAGIPEFANGQYREAPLRDR